MNEDDLVKTTLDDLPALFRAADLTSSNAQKKYLRLMGTDLTLLVIAAIFGAFALNISLVKTLVAVASAIVLGISVVVTSIIRASHLENDWFEYRAIAESVKTLAWRYMTCSEPYRNDSEIAKIDEKFTSDLLSLLNRRRDVSSALDSGFDLEPQITEHMRQVRNMEVDGRKTVYISDRIYDQRKWYSDKAKSNFRSTNKYFRVMLGSQIAAFISAIILVRWPECPINPTGIFVVLATAFLAWMQLKQHQELAQSYALTAQKLGLVSEQIKYVRTSDELSSFVSDFENEISQEHKLWLTRRMKQ